MHSPIAPSHTLIPEGVKELSGATALLLFAIAKAQLLKNHLAPGKPAEEPCHGYVDVGDRHGI